MKHYEKHEQFRKDAMAAWNDHRFQSSPLPLTEEQVEDWLVRLESGLPASATDRPS